MDTVTPKQKKQISQYLVTLVHILLFSYFAYHLLHGERGYFARKGMQSTLQETQERYETVHKQRVELENRVKLLRPDSLDLDMLDERARIVLGYVKPSEKVILRK